jgi:hypothetical protein
VGGLKAGDPECQIAMVNISGLGDFKALGKNKQKPDSQLCFLIKPGQEL